MRILIAVLALICLLPQTAHAGGVNYADFHVTSTADSGPNTLRQAIINGNAIPTSYVPRILIDLDYNSPILLASPLPILTAPNFEIEGTQSTSAKIDGGGVHAILATSSSVLLFSMKNLALFNGYSTLYGACLTMTDPDTEGSAYLDNVVFQNCIVSGDDGINGGAIQTLHNLTINDSVFQFNSVVSTGSSSGGAISFLGDRDLTIRGSYFGSNKSVSNAPTGTNVAEGGVISVQSGRSVTIEDSVFTDNHVNTPYNNDPVAGLGGALAVRLSGKLSLLRAALFGNDAGTGGAIYHRAVTPGSSSADLRNVSAVHNRAKHGNGGALVSDSPVILYNNTFWRNSAALAGDNLFLVPTAQTSMAYNNLFAAGVGAGDSCTGFPTMSSGYNIVPALECGLGADATDLVTSDLHIRGLFVGAGGDYSVQLYSSSPALDVGNPLAPSDAIAGRCAMTDFLGQPRPMDASGTGATPRCDIGALEAQSEPSLFVDDFDGGWLRP